MTDHLPEEWRTDEYVKGYTAGLSAARDAVEKVGQQHPKWDLISTHYEGCWKSHPECALTLALDAIDGLRGSGNPDTPPSAEKGEQA